MRERGRYSLADYLMFGGDAIHWEYQSLAIKTMTTVTIQLDDELEEQLKKFSQASNLSMEEAVKELIRRKWELRKIRELRKNARAQAEKAGITSDEDVYQVVQDARRERRQSESAR